MVSRLKWSKHFLADKVPVLIAAVIMLAGPLLIGLISNWLLEPFYNDSNGKLLTNLWCVFGILFSLLLLLLFERWFRPEYEGTTKLPGLVYGLKLSIPVLIFWSVWMAVKARIGVINFYPLDPESFIKGLRPGVSEESLFRGMAMALLLRKYRTKEKLWIPLVVTAVIFGLSHYTNIESREEFLLITITSMFAVFFGVIFCVIFSLSGSVWPVIIVHSLYDIAMMCRENAPDASDWPTFVDIGATAVMMVGYIILYNRRREQITALWDRKWSDTP